MIILEKMSKKYVHICLSFIFTFLILLSGNVYANNYTLSDENYIRKEKGSAQIIYKGQIGEGFEIVAEDDFGYQIKLDENTTGWVRKPIQALGVYNYGQSGKVLASHSDDSIKVSVEKINGATVAKIWCLDPGKQIKKVEAGWGTNLQTASSMIASVPGAIVGSNGSGFYKKGTWDPVADDKALKGTDYNMTTEGYLVISNGVIRRAIEGQKCNAILGILPNGSLKYYNSSYQSVIDDGVQNTFAFGPLLVSDGELIGTGDTRVAQRIGFGQLDANNFVIINYYGTLTQLGQIGRNLGCKIFYNLDGGGSSCLWVKGESIKNSTREVADALCFVTLN